MKEQKIIALVKELYQLEVNLKPLPGYDEQNYLATTEDNQKYILKISRDSKAFGVLKAQSEMLLFLNKKEMKEVFPLPIYTLSGKTVTKLEEEKGNPLFIRMVKFLPGIFWAERKTHSTELLKNLGTFLGKMDFHLKDFHSSDAHRYHNWDIQNTVDRKKNLDHITIHADRRLVDYFLLQFEENVIPVLSELRHQVIHGDANDWNILTNSEGDFVSGLIDFGDMVYSPVINNLAVALTYAMLDKENPLEIASTIVKAYYEENPLTEQEVDLLYYLIAGRLCISLIHSATQKDEGSDNPHHFLTEKHAWKLLYDWIEINPLKARQTFRNACGMTSLYEEKEDYSQLLIHRNKHIGRNLSVSYRQPLKIVRGALQYLYDDQGRTFLDCVNNVSHIGHNHPVLVRAMQSQIARLNTNTRYLHEDLVAYAEEIIQTLPDNLQVCYFVNSGSEANDLAIRMARNFTGNKDIIVLDHAYHGTSTLALEMSPYKFDGKGGFPQKEYIHKAQNPDAYRGKYKYDDVEAGAKYAKDIARITKELATQNKKPAAFICETLLGVGGQIPLPEGYLKAAYEYIRKAGGVAIADEVQVGFGRVGSKFWGFELQEVRPDIVVMGKPMGNGHPLAAVVVTREIADAFNNGMEYFNTFGGNPVSMVAGRTVLKIIKEEELQENALEVGSYLLELLKELQKNHRIIGDVRGEGLFIGAEFVRDKNTLEPAADELNETVERMKERGFLLSTDGPLNNVLKIKPPVVFSKKNAEDLTFHLSEVLKELKL